MRRARAVAFVLLAAGFAATFWIDPWADERVNDLFVYRSFADSVLDGALPYRDVFFEYPPLAAPVIALPGVAGGGEAGYRIAFGALALALAGAVLLLGAILADRTGGDRVRALVAVALAPLLCGAMIRTHFDLAPVALTLGALLLLVGGRPRAGLAVLGAATMTKGFPLVVAPVALAWLYARGERRAVVEGATALVAVVGVLAGMALAFSPDGAAEAVRYHVERPVQVESSPATLLVALDAIGLGDTRSVAAPRSDGFTHPADGAIVVAFAAALLAVLGLLATAAARRPDERGLVLASLAAIAAFAAFGKVLSPQFLIWTVPLGALAVAWRMPALAAAVGAATLLTLVEFPSRYFDLVDRDAFPLGVVALRNLLLLAAVAIAVRALRHQAGSSSWRIAVALPPSSASTRTAFNQGSSSEVSKRTCV